MSMIRNLGDASPTLSRKGDAKEPLKRLAPKSAMQAHDHEPAVTCSSLRSGHRKEAFAVHGLRKISIRLRLHLYCPLAREVKWLLRLRVPLRPRPEDRCNMDGGW